MPGIRGRRKKREAEGIGYRGATSDGDQNTDGLFRLLTSDE
jgi:hypothetical protein